VGLRALERGFGPRVIESLLHREILVRLAKLLINLSDRFGEDDGTGMLIGVCLTHQDLANMIASTREAVSKAMSELQRDSVIEMRNHRIAILDRGALSKRASGRSSLFADGQLPI
jgi:CRP-like cAMP-binding protein